MKKNKKILIIVSLVLVILLVGVLVILGVKGSGKKDSKKSSNEVSGVSVTIKESENKKVKSIKIYGKTEEVLADSSKKKSPSNIASFKFLASDGNLKIVSENPESKEKVEYNVVLKDINGNVITNLKSVNDISDSIEKVNGKWGIYKRIEQEEVTMTNSVYGTEFENTKRFKIELAKKLKDKPKTNDDKPNIICTHYNTVSPTKAYTSKNLDGISQVDINILAIRDSHYSILENNSQYFSYLFSERNNGHPVIVLYPLAKAEFIELDSEANNVLNSISMQKGKTKIYIDGDIKPSNIVVKY